MSFLDKMLLFFDLIYICCCIFAYQRFYSEFILYTRYIFVFGNSFLHPLHFWILKYFLHPPYFCNSEFPLYIHTLYFWIRKLFFTPAIFLHLDILFKIQFIFVFGKSFFLPAIFQYSRIPFSPVTLLYSEIPLCTFYILYSYLPSTSCFLFSTPSTYWW